MLSSMDFSGKKVLLKIQCPSDGLIRSVDKGNIIHRSNFCNLCNAGSNITLTEAKKKLSWKYIISSSSIFNTVLEKWKGENKMKWESKIFNDSTSVAYVAYSADILKVNWSLRLQKNLKEDLILRIWG